MGQEIRKVPKDWKHPKDKFGRYIPMLDAAAYGGNYEHDLNSWINNYQLWQKGEHPDQKQYPSETADCRHYALWANDPPVLECFRPIKWNEKEACCFQLYETVSYGTPIGPVLETLEDLAAWLIKHDGYYEAIMTLTEFGIPPSLSLQLEQDHPRTKPVKKTPKQKKGRRL